MPTHIKFSWNLALSASSNITNLTHLNVLTVRKETFFLSFQPFGSLQVIVGLLKLPNVFVELLLDAACLAKVVL